MVESIRSADQDFSGITAAIAACSDPVIDRNREYTIQAVEKLESLGINVIVGDNVFRTDTAMDPAAKAEVLNSFFRNEKVTHIFDVSGGNLSNTVLPYVDMEAAAKSRAVLHGYSDLTALMNGIVARTGRPAVNYQIRNIVRDHADVQLDYLLGSVFKNSIAPTDIECTFIRGSRMEGRLLGGNLRCFIKLAGTPYWPDTKGAILLFEGLGGGPFKMMTYIEQYSQMGVFDEINGVIIGTFSDIENNDLKPTVPEMILRWVPERVPVALTRYIGHKTDARAAVIGTYQSFS